MKPGAGKVFYAGELAGRIERTDDGRYLFTYWPEYLARPGARAVSLTLPLRSEPYESPVLFSFFAGLLAEGNLKDLQVEIFAIHPDDDFTRLIKTAGWDTIGAVTVEEETDEGIAEALYRDAEFERSPDIGITLARPSLLEGEKSARPL